MLRPFSCVPVYSYACVNMCERKQITRDTSADTGMLTLEHAQDDNEHTLFSQVQYF